MKITYLTLLYFSFSLLSCRTFIKQRESQLVFDGKKFSLPAGCLSLVYVSLEKMSGTFIYSGQNFFFVFGRNDFFVPLNMKEEFVLAFKGNYYNKFFEKIHIDPKVHKLFIDSVQISDVYKITENSEKMLINCSACTMVAKLVFRNNNYYFPFFSNQYRDTNSEYIIESDTVRRYERKLWMSQSDTLNSGLIIRPLDKNLSHQSLMIKSKTGKSSPEVKRLFYLVNPIN